MAISNRDRKLLWARSGNCCAFPGCRCELTQDAESGDSSFPVGVEAHIVGRTPNSPRGEHPLPLEDRDRCENLVLLCPTHHTIIDNDVGTYTVERLHEIKQDHEQWVREKLGPQGPPTISLANLPVTSPDLFGRERELQILDQAWQDPQTNIVAFIAFGGIGKSAIVNHWLRQMEKDDFRVARRVFGWSFYSQGTREGAVSADQFIHSALTFFGDPHPTEGSPWDKGQRLAQLIRRQPTLLILDGLEPLQWGAGAQAGELKDRAGSMYPLLRELSHSMDGLCVLSSRVDITDLPLSDVVWEPGPPGDTPAALRVNLERLSTDAGRELLKHYTVKGLDSELDAAVQEYEGHALALCLLAEYLVELLDGDIARRDLVPPLQQETRQGRHAFRVMDAYEIALKRDGREPERAILRLLGLFDRPASKGCLDALRRAPAIQGVTDSLIGLSDLDWRHAVGRLRKWRLLSRPRGEDDGSLDSHPLVREHFGHKLEQQSPDGFRHAHSRLYEHLRDTTKELPDTLEEMEPLFQAIHHACRASRHQEVYHDILVPRIRRGADDFAVHNLGAFASQLAALHEFFHQPWRALVRGLTAKARCFLLNEAGYDLRALGRLEEASQPIRIALDLDLEHGRRTSAARSARNLVRSHLASGALVDAAEVSGIAVQLAECCAVPFERLSNRADRGAVLHHLGRLSEARERFVEAEQILTEARFSDGPTHSDDEEVQPAERLLRTGQLPCACLYGVPGAHYCHYLLHLGDAPAAYHRAAQAIKAARMISRLLDLGLDHLNLGRACCLLAHTSSSKRPRPSDASAHGQHGIARVLQGEASRHLGESVDAFRRASRHEYLPESLLARASFHRDFGEHEQAERDLEEALDLSTRIGLRLHETDARLLEGHMALDPDPPDLETAQQSLARAHHLVEETGYHLRDADSLILQGRLLAKQGDKEAGRAKLEEAITVARREEADGCVYQLAVDQAERYLEAL